MSFVTDYLQDVEATAAIGVLGFLIYVLTYMALSLRFLDSESVSYFAFNILAALLVLYSLSADFNLASALIQVFWIGIGATAIFLRVSRQRREARALKSRILVLTRPISTPANDGAAWRQDDAETPTFQSRRAAAE